MRTITVTVHGKLVSDRRIAMLNGNNEVENYAEIMVINAYYPFGMAMASSSYSSEAYRYGFNGKEKDDEIKGSGASYDYGFRIYDPRLGKFLSVDPLSASFPWNSSYAYAENDVIRCIDLDGLEKVALSGYVPPSEYGKGNSYNATHVKYFKAQGDRLSKIYGYHAHQVLSGNEIISKLKDETAAHGSITSVVIFAHAGSGGIYLRDGLGFYFDTAEELGKAVKEGTIKFAKNAIIFFDACNVGNDFIGGYFGNPPPYAIAQKITLETGVTTIGAKGSVEMVDQTKADGRFKSDGGFYKYTLVEYQYTEVEKILNPNYAWYNSLWTDKFISIEVEKTGYKVEETYLGNEIKVDDYVPSP